MTELKAFVGHSFAESDEIVIRGFLEYFNEIQDLGVGFVWDHAQKSESKDLADKVLEKIEDKNLFIGICTKKECVIDSDVISPLPFNFGLIRGPYNNSFKTSDWLLQEIGLAIGRNMKLILLIEEGVRNPGGLQGNHEYITFDRDAPEKSYTKILQSIRSLLPIEISHTVEHATSATVSEPAEQIDSGDNFSWDEPKENWEHSDYEFALWKMLKDDDAEGADKIYRAFLDSNDPEDKDTSDGWKALYEYYRLLYGRGGTIQKLKDMAVLLPNNVRVQRILGLGYRIYEEYSMSAVQFLHAAEQSISSDDILSNNKNAYLDFTKSGEKEKAKAILNQIKIEAAKIEDGEALLIDTLLQIDDAELDVEYYFGLAERYLELKPDDNDRRFSLALKYSEAEHTDASLYHYLKTPYHNRNSGTWNNIGVAYENLKLKSKSINAYKKAMNKGETLAMSNQAYRLLDAGFLEEAQKICNEGLKIEGCVKNVNLAMSRIKEIPNEENEKEKDVLEKVAPLSIFFRSLGAAITENNLADYKGKWQGPKCELNVVITNNNFIAEGSYSRPKGLGIISNAILGKEGGIPPREEKIFNVKYEGKILGEAVIGYYSESDGTQSTRLLDEKDNKHKVLMIIDIKGGEAKVHETGTVNNRKYYELEFIE